MSEVHSTLVTMVTKTSDGMVVVNIGDGEVVLTFSPTQAAAFAKDLTDAARTVARDTLCQLKT